MLSNWLSEQSYTSKKFSIWTSLSFQAGFVNVGGLLSCHRFVTHTTGFATHFGVDMAQGNFLNALGMLSVPLFFLMGSMISGFFTEYKKNKSHPPNFLILFCILCGCFLSVSALGMFHFFGEFGSELSLIDDYFLLGLLSLAAGVQNAMITSVSQSIIRTTHLTGITTDLGLGLIKIMSLPKNNPVKENEILATGMRISIIISFAFGSWMGASLFLKHGYLGFLVPFFISSIFLALSRKK